ncbi:MAG TPA: sugar phosphate isomerase/epimerase [Phycisphaerae bacterium]|nr:sugar phosphate isomerase/epimerase [Phycisphaerae bacterium]
MQVGILTQTFDRPTLEETLDAVAMHGLDCVQFDMVCAGADAMPDPTGAGVSKPAMPDRIDVRVSDRIRGEMTARDITMAAVTGAFNMIHPDPQRRSNGLQRLDELASACERLGTSVITLCTGSRDPDIMWRWHPENDSPEAWKDLVATMSRAVEIAQEKNVTLAFEPEANQVVGTARKSRRLLDEMQSPCLKVVMDAANLFHTGELSSSDELSRIPEVLDEAFELLGEDIVIAHAKDVDQQGERHVAAGKGVLDYDRYLSLLHAAGFDGPIVLHTLEESEVAQCVAFLRGKLASLGYGSVSEVGGNRGSR